METKQYFCRELDTLTPEIERTLIVNAISEEAVKKIVDARLIEHGLRPYSEKPYRIIEIEKRIRFSIDEHNQNPGSGIGGPGISV